MKVLDSPITDSVWQQFQNEMTPPIPEGFETKVQIAAKIKRGLTQTKFFLRRLMADDKLDVFTAVNGTKYYRPKNYGQTRVGQKHRCNR